MERKEEPAITGSRELNFNPIVSNNSDFSSLSEHNFSKRAGFGGCPRDPYLTYTDKSPSTPVKNSQNFKDFSMKLYLETMKLYKSNKKVLQIFHCRGWQKIKYINDSNIVLYRPSNPAGNSNAGWLLAKKNSNTDKARLSSKQNAFEKALANVDLWEYFATFTLDRKKQDRYNFEKALNHITKFLQRRHISYFLVPERHQDGAWHFHALLSSEMGAYLEDFTGKALKNHYIAHCLALHRPIKHCRAYTERFGFNTIEPCRNKEACSFYMTKYVLKTFNDPNFERVSRRRYFTSKGLKSPVVILPSQIDLDDFEVSGLSSYTEKVFLKRYNVPAWAYIATQESPTSETAPPL